MVDIVLINPRFEISYWGLEHAMPYLGKRAAFPVAALSLLAALTPDQHTVTLIDENVQAIDFGRCARADIVGLTGMSVQRFRMREILGELKQRGIFTIVGGPWVTLQEDYFDGLADAIFVGEAEDTWPLFLTEWVEGRHTRRYEQAERTDMSQMPVPRFDLLPMKHYAFGSVQFSRGCPFTCEFCDIIVTFGRRPRLKTVGQVIAEIEALHTEGAPFVFIVDDNLIGNKAAIKPILREVAVWQEAHGYPLTFFTEASLDLADDAELLALMSAVNIVTVFVGIESPNEAALIEAKKRQNLRGERTLVEKVRVIQDAGLEVWCGMILGFDDDDSTIFEAHRRFIAEARIIHSMTGMLTALPKTPLHKRLTIEGRLDPTDLSPFGTNVIPLRLGRDELQTGYIALMGELYAPGAYFDRFEALFVQGGLRFNQTRRQYWSAHPWSGLLASARAFFQAAGILARLQWRVGDPALRREYRRRLVSLLRVRREPEVLLVYAVKCAIHAHVHALTQAMVRGEPRFGNTF
ncbi:MAG: Fe-S oxidoreductase [Rhodospirillales bacterium]|nr:Fe-S oxidoreductase [Rhodospirillales bacterium]